MSTIRGGGDVSIRVFDKNTEVQTSMFREGRNRAEEMKVSLGHGQSIGLALPKHALVREYHLKPGCYTLFVEYRNLSLGTNSFPKYLKSNRIKFCIS
ncbi:MAG: hypothetical protein WC655_23190 [Candidatus Hydrogenedentales bacterium]|jgi:hypothetical protein